MIALQRHRRVWLSMALCLGMCAVIPIVFPCHAYLESEVTFQNEAAGISLSGTLTKPVGQGPFPALLLIGGEGPDDREYGNIFSLIAHRLGRKGIASLRFDERGVGRSSGDFSNATIVEFADDAHCAIKWLGASRSFSSIGVLGHSEGGLVASIAATRTENVSFVIMLSTRGRARCVSKAAWKARWDKENGRTRETTEKSLRISALLDELIRSGKSDAKTTSLVKDIVSKTMRVPNVDKEVKRLLSPNYRFSLDYDPATHMRNINCPVLVIGGALDTWVQPAHEFPAIERALRSNRNADVTFESIPGLNHCLQKCNTGSIEEANELRDQPVDNRAIELIETWIKARGSIKTKMGEEK